MPKYIDYCVHDSAVLEKEAYLTDIIEVCKKFGERVSYYKANDYRSVIGINTLEELEFVNDFINM